MTLLNSKKVDPISTTLEQEKLNNIDPVVTDLIENSGGHLDFNFSVNPPIVARFFFIFIFTFQNLF